MNLIAVGILLCIAILAIGFAIKMIWKMAAVALCILVAFAVIGVVYQNGGQEEIAEMTKNIKESDAYNQTKDYAKDTADSIWDWTKKKAKEALIDALTDDEDGNKKD